MSKIGNLPLLILFVIFLFLFIYSLSRIFKNEKGFKLIISVIIIGILPILGSLSYLIYDKFFINKTSLNK